MCNRLKCIQEMCHDWDSLFPLHLYNLTGMAFRCDYRPVNIALYRQGKTQGLTEWTQIFRQDFGGQPYSNAGPYGHL